MSLLPVRRAALLLVLLLAAASVGCGGTKVLKEPQPLVVTPEPLAGVRDERVAVTLNWVIVRDGPGTWARHADWDEYLLSVENLSAAPLRILGLTVYDSLGTPLEPQTDRKRLVKSSRTSVKRYKNAGTKIEAGRGAGTLLVAGAAVTAIGVTTASVAVTGAAWGGAAGGAAAAASGMLLLGPALVVGGVIRGVNNSAVNSEIQRRQTPLPLELPAASGATLNVFLPLAPSPQRIEIRYLDASEYPGIAVIDVNAALHDLHFVTTATAPH